LVHRSCFNQAIVLSVQGLTKRFNDVAAVDDLSLDVAMGEIFFEGLW
jgi:ABC-type branched-subunit amino acid transport system ATPase component